MTYEETLARFSQLVGELLENDSVELTLETVADEVYGWDSLTHVRIILAAEAEFGVVFTTSEVGSLNNVRDIIDLIQSRSK